VLDDRQIVVLALRQTPRVGIVKLIVDGKRVFVRLGEVHEASDVVGGSGSVEADASDGHVGEKRPGGVVIGQAGVGGDCREKKIVDFGGGAGVEDRGLELGRRGGFGKGGG
jgi:hypothetical protein